jgi:thiol:disulfide interchange protein DsbD
MRTSTALIFSLTTVGQAFAQDVDDRSPHSEAQLVAEVSAVRPGEAFTVALRLLMDKDWHSYWRNPGDAGTPTSIEWSLDPGFQADSMQWPYPEAIAAPPLMSFGYRDEVFLLVEITPPQDLVSGATLLLEGEAYWLICTDICLPAEQHVTLELPVAESARLDERWASTFAATRDLLPKLIDGWETEAQSTGNGYTLQVRSVNGRSLWGGSPHYFSIDEAVVAAAAPQSVIRDGGSLTIHLIESSYASGPATRLNGVLVAPEGETWDQAGRFRALAVDVPVSQTSGGPTPLNREAAAVTFAMALVFAFLGGLLLNLMPCVFPILSIKVLGFVHRGGEARFKAGAHGLAFGVGVILSFCVLAAMILMIRAGGSRLGWGFQLQSPVFVAAMAILFFGLALNLMGVFEVGTLMARFGGRVAQPEGLGDSFASGVLATVIATPCTAPFMGAALGFALMQPTWETMLVFAVLGLGMAAPYVVLSMSPALLGLLPRPGAWMETLRQLLAFPLLGTVIWLIWVFGRQTGVNGAAHLLAALMLLSFAGWIIGRWKFQVVGMRTRLLTRSVAVAALTLGVALVVRGSRGEDGVIGSSHWQPFSQELVQQLRSEGQPVFVDFTAAWCLSCQVNERVVLSSSTVKTAFAESNVAALQADWTRFDLAITEALESFGRSGVPLYVLYPADQERPPLILPTILTKKGVLEALRYLTDTAQQSSTSAVIAR